LKEIYYEEGDKEKAVLECLSLASILKAKNRAAEAQDQINEAIRIDPNNARVKEFTGAAPAPQIPQPKAPPTKSAPAGPRAPKPIAAPQPAARATKPIAVTRTPELELEEIPSAAGLEIEPTRLTAGPAKAVQPKDEADLELEIEMPEEPAPKRPSTTRPSTTPTVRGGSHTQAATRPALEKVEEETPEDLAGGLSLGDSGDELTTELDVERAFGAQTVVLPPHRPTVEDVPRAARAKPVFKVEKATEPIAAEGDFFDLASELDRSLAEAQVAVDTQEQESIEGPGHSLDEIFKAFRKGVEQQVDSQDYETHYNLGIAYKEMGLVDEAIGEF